MVQGVDLWLNNPRRGEEACGTSGMKAGINGVLNLSILDGWFDEAYENSGGWAIGDREPYSDDQDGLHASAIYYLLENEIVPMFYERREQTPARMDAAREAVAARTSPRSSIAAAWCGSICPSCTSRRISSTSGWWTATTTWRAKRPNGTSASARFGSGSASWTRIPARPDR